MLNHSHLFKTKVSANSFPFSFKRNSFSYERFCLILKVGVFETQNGQVSIVYFQKTYAFKISLLF